MIRSLVSCDMCGGSIEHIGPGGEVADVVQAFVAEHDDDHDHDLGVRLDGVARCVDLAWGAAARAAVECVTPEGLNFGSAAAVTAALRALGEAGAMIGVAAGNAEVDDPEDSLSVGEAIALGQDYPMTVRDGDLIDCIRLAAARGAEAWGPWSTGERLIVGLALDDSDLIADTGYAYTDAVRRWQREMGFPDASTTERWIEGLRRRAEVTSRRDPEDGK